MSRRLLRCIGQALGGSLLVAVIAAVAFVLLAGLVGFFAGGLVGALALIASTLKWMLIAIGIFLPISVLWNIAICMFRVERPSRTLAGTFPSPSGAADACFDCKHPMVPLAFGWFGLAIGAVAMFLHLR